MNIHPTDSVPKKKFGQYSRQAFQNLYSCLLFSKAILSSIDGYVKAFLNGLKNNFRADEIALQVEGLAARPADLSLVPRTHVSQVRTNTVQLSCDFHTCAVVSALPP